MSKAISTKLKKLEQQIEDGVVGIRTALLEIHDKKLYGECFEAYCKDRWGFSRQHGYNIIKAARAAQQVSTKVDTSGMKTSHLLVIADAPELKQADVACDVLKACEEENRKATAKDFKKAVRAALPAPKKKTPKPTSGDSPLSTGHSGAVESSVGHQRQPGDESEEGGADPIKGPDWKKQRAKCLARANELQRDIDDLMAVRSSGNPRRHKSAIKATQDAIKLLEEWA